MIKSILYYISKRKYNSIRKLVFRRKIRCERCHEIQILKDILISNGVNGLITSECLNHHGRILCPIKDFCDDKTQFDQINCGVCDEV